MGFSRKFNGVGNDLAAGLGWAVVPDGVNQIHTGAQGDLAIGQITFQCFDFGHRMEPWVKPDDAMRYLIFYPCGGLCLWPIHWGKGRARFGLDLYTVATVDKDARVFG